MAVKTCDIYSYHCTCFMPTRKDHADILGHLCFVWFIVVFNVCITPLLVLYHNLHCDPRPFSYASLAVGLNAKCTGQGTNIYDLCTRSMWPDHLTTLQIGVFWSILAITLGCNFHRLELGARDWLPNTTIKLLCILRSWTFNHQFIPQSPTHRSARTWDPTHYKGLFLVFSGWDMELNMLLPSAEVTNKWNQTSTSSSWCAQWQK